MQRRFGILIPAIIIVYVPPNIGGITVDEVGISCGTDRIVKRLAYEIPRISLQKFLNMCNLVYNFRDIGFGKTQRLMPIGNIEFIILVKAHHSVETRTIQEKEIQRIVFFIEAVAHFIVINIVPLFQFLPLGFQKRTNKPTGNFAAFYASVKVNDMRVRICKYGTLWFDVKADNTGPHKRLKPYRVISQLNMFTNQGYNLRLNALDFQRWDMDFFVHFFLGLNVLGLFKSGGSPLYSRYLANDAIGFNFPSTIILIFP